MKNVVWYILHTVFPFIIVLACYKQIIWFFILFRVIIMVPFYGDWYQHIVYFPIVITVFLPSRAWFPCSQPQASIRLRSRSHHLPELLHWPLLAPLLTLLARLALPPTRAHHTTQLLPLWYILPYPLPVLPYSLPAAVVGRVHRNRLAPWRQLCAEFWKLPECLPQLWGQLP